MRRRHFLVAGLLTLQYVAVLPSLDLVVVRLGVSADRAWSLGAFLREIVAAQRG